jgi:hypothetical protein
LGGPLGSPTANTPRPRQRQGAGPVPPAHEDRAGRADRGMRTARRNPHVTTVDIRASLDRGRPRAGAPPTTDDVPVEAGQALPGGPLSRSPRRPAGDQHSLKWPARSPCRRRSGGDSDVAVGDQELRQAG